MLITSVAKIIMNISIIIISFVDIIIARGINIARDIFITAMNLETGIMKCSTFSITIINIATIDMTIINIIITNIIVTRDIVINVIITETTDIVTNSSSTSSTPKGQ